MAHAVKRSVVSLLVLAGVLAAAVAVMDVAWGYFLGIRRAELAIIAFFLAIDVVVLLLTELAIDGEAALA